MSGNNAEVVFAGNAKQLLDEYKKLEQANEQLNQKLLAAMKVSKQAANEEKKLRQEVTAAIEKSKTPAEAYIATINRYKQALQAGMITADQFNRIRDKELQKLNAAKSATDGLTDAQKRAATATTAASATSDKASLATTVMASSFKVVTAAITAATAALRIYGDEKKRFQQEGAATVLSIDEMSRDYAIQGGLKTEAQREQATQEILAKARENASTPAQAFSAASQLASSGFEAPTGETLDSGLKILKTSDMAQSDGKAYFDAAAKFLKASNQKLNGKNLLELGIAMRGLVDTPVQASDLAEFSEAAPVLNMQGVDWKTGLGMMTELRRAFSGATAGTKMRNITQRLQTAKDDKQAQEALKEIGLTPQDVDAVGETMPNALRKIGASVNALPVEDRASVLGRIFNNENVAAADVLIKNIDAVDKNVQAMSDTSLFTAGVNFKMQGPSADAVRGDIDKQLGQLQMQETIANRERLIRSEAAFWNSQFSAIDNDPSKGWLGKTASGVALSVAKSAKQNVSDQFFQPEDYVPVEYQNAVKAFQGSGQFTSQDLDNRRAVGNTPAAPALDSASIVNAINNQTAVLSGKLTPPAKPTDNPNLQGRPKN